MCKKLIEIKKAKKVIFVGDTHGDLEVSQKVIRDYLKPGNKIVFLGDYVDRGPFSKENLNFLLEERKKFPDQIFLLQGNHEGYPILKFSPAEFWENLTPQEYYKFSKIVKNMGWLAVIKNIIALHGALPEVKSLKEIEKMKLGDKSWFRICWGDFYEKPGDYLGIDPFSGRPQFGRDYFFRLMERFKKSILIRSHQLNAPQFMFNNRCVTIFTSSAYKKERKICIADFSKKIKTASDLEIITI